MPTHAHRTALGLFVAFALIYLGTAKGILEEVDDVAMLRVTESIVRSASFAVAPDTPGASEGRDGRFYPRYGLGQSLLGIPFYVVGAALPADVKTQNVYDPHGFVLATPLAFAMTGVGIVSAAATVALVYLTARVTRFSDAASLAAAVCIGLGTFTWFYSRTFMTEAPSMFFTLLTVYGVLRFSVDGSSLRWLLVSGAAAGMLLLLRVGNAILLPPVGVWLLWIVAQDIALRRSTAALAGDAVTAESHGVALHTSTPKGSLGESSPGSDATAHAVAPAQPTTRPAQPTADPAQQTADPADATIAPTQPTTGRAQHIAGPAQETNAPTQPTPSRTEHTPGRAQQTTGTAQPMTRSALAQQTARSGQQTARSGRQTTGTTRLSSGALFRHVAVPLAAWGSPILVAILLVGAYNAVRFGSPAETGYGETAQAFTTPLYIGLYGLLLSPGKSVFLYAPILLAAIFGWFPLRRRHAALAWTLAAMTTFYLLFYARYDWWYGGGPWAPRFLTVILPLAGLPIAALLARPLPRPTLLALAALVLASVAVQLLSLLVPYLPYDATMEQDPAHFDLMLWHPAFSPLVAATRDLVHRTYPPDLAFSYFAIPALAPLQLAATACGAILLLVLIRNARIRQRSAAAPRPPTA